MNRLPAKPRKTATDHIVMTLSPVLIMLLVGSLCFFLIQVLYRGEAVNSVRWVMFWFVLATVLVSRIGIEQGRAQAMAYGLALALATWLYLLRVHPAYLLGALLLGTVWWCAHKLTWDCTLIDDEDDATGNGLLQILGKWRKPKQLPAAQPAKEKPKSQKTEKKPKVLHAPGIGLVYFSIAAIPLFGIGQMLLPGGDAAARRMGFIYLFTYLAAALGLSLTTSFLGLRRYLRQRYLPMPGNVAFGWMRFGAGMAGLVLIAALLLPRPGAEAAWGALSYHIDYQLRRASRIALKFSPHGTGGGTASQHGQTGKDGEGDVSQKPPGTPSEPGGQPGRIGEPNAASPQPGAPAGRQPGTPEKNLETPGEGIFWGLKTLFWAVMAGLMIWWLWRRRGLLGQMARAAWEGLVNFLRDLLSWGQTPMKPSSGTPPVPARRAFATFENPFGAGADRAWPVAELVLHTHEALRNWAAEIGVESGPNQTAREFSRELGERFPELNAGLEHLAFLYGHVAYGRSVPAHYDEETLKRLWEHMTQSEAVAA